MSYSFSLLSEKSLTIFLNKKISIEAHLEILIIKQKIEKENLAWLVEVVPSYNSVSIFVNPSFYQFHESLLVFFEKWFSEIDFDAKVAVQTKSEIKTIAMKYDGIDLSYVANHCKLSVNQVIEIHSSPIYTVAMIGFLPGFPYLLGMDERLFVPRKSAPRLKVEKGSVGLAGFQTGIYPFESPGGWQIIGKTDVELFDIENLSYLSIGDRVKFTPV